MRRMLLALCGLGILPLVAQQAVDDSEVDAGADASAGRPAVTREEIIEHIGDPSPWTEGDLKALDSGELVTGYFLLGLPAKAPANYFPQLPKQTEDLPEPERYEDVEEVDRSWISKETLLQYFAKKPEAELIDPQGLLSRQAYTDRAAFLSYHRRDSNIPIYIYLFDGPQEVPTGYDVAEQLKSQLGTKEPALLAYYFLGKPEKSEIAISPELKQSLSLLEYKRVLDSAISEAAEKTDPIDQLEGFAVQLSIRMYWIERAMREASAEPKLVPGLAAVLPVAKSPESSKSPVKAAGVPFFHRYGNHLFAALIIMLAGLAGCIVRRITLTKRRYFFPELDLPDRLSAPHAAGVGAVMHFRSPQIPPSSQREQVPDYLQKY